MRRTAELMKQADVALYRLGRWSRVYRFSSRQCLHESRSNALRGGFAARNKQKPIRAVSPVIDIEDCRIVGLEALLRWHHPERGMISPAEFVPAAEETGLIAPLGEWVIRQACADAAKWPSHIKIAVNLSPAQFRSHKLAQVVIEALAAAAVAPSRLELEITEAILLGHDRENPAVLEQVRGLGIKLIMDAFGVGYSSLNYLRLFRSTRSRSTAPSSTISPTAMTSHLPSCNRWRGSPGSSRCRRPRRG